MNSDANKDTASLSPSVSGEFKIVSEENLEINFEASIIDATANYANTPPLLTYGFDVDKIARLANLPLTTEEKDKFSKQLFNILSYIAKLNEVDTTNVEPTFNVTGESNVMREDETAGCLSQEEALQNAPKKKDGMFETKGVFEEE